MAPITRAVTSYRKDNHFGSISEAQLAEILEWLTKHNVEYAMPPITSQAIGPNHHFNNLMDRVSTAVRMAVKTGDGPVLDCIDEFVQDVDWNIPPVVNPVLPDVQLHDVEWVDKIDDAVRGCTPLHIAAMYGQKEVMQFLLDRDMHVDAGVPTLLHPPTAFYYGLHTAHAETVISILLDDHGADVNSLVSPQGEPLIVDAIRRSCFKTACLLWDMGADCDFETDDGKTLLHLCCEAEPPKGVTYDTEEAWVALVKKLLELKLSANKKDEAGCTPLHYAAMRQQGVSAAVMVLLYKEGARDDDKNNCDRTPFNLLCLTAYTSEDALERLKRFLNVCTRVNLEQKAPNGHTALHNACWASRKKGDESLQIRVAETLLDHQADGRDILYDLIKWPGTWPALKLLVHRGCINEWSHAEAINLFLEAKGTRNQGYIERCRYCLNDCDLDTLEEMRYNRRHRSSDMY